jgi:hypothetical protein
MNVFPRQGSTPVRLRGFGGEKAELGTFTEAGAICLPRRPLHHIDILPVVRTCTLELAIIQTETQRMNQMQTRTGS